MKKEKYGCFHRLNFHAKEKSPKIPCTCKPVTDWEFLGLQDLLGHQLRLEDLDFPEVKKNGKEEKEIYQFPSDKEISSTLS